jgi:hypothetical protein
MVGWKMVGRKMVGWAERSEPHHEFLAFPQRKLYRRSAGKARQKVV